MTASDHLSPGQFMPMSEALALRSRDYGGLVGDVLPRLRGSARYDAIKADMAAHGQKDPVRVEGYDLHGGHHRIAVAHDLGWPGIRADVKYR